MVKGIILGDSHAFHLKEFDNIDCESQAFIAGSAKGLSNPNSLSGYGSYISQNWGTLTDDKQIVIFKFGQVDVEFLYHLRNIQVSIDFEAYILNVVKHYIEFIKKLNDNNKIICVMSIFPPCFNDNYFLTFIKYLNDERKWNISNELIDKYYIPSLETRSQMHKRFNNILKIEVQKYNYIYIDCYTCLLNSQQTINRDYISHDMNDCHLSNFSTPLLPCAKTNIENALKPVFLAIEKDFDFF